MNNIEYKIKLFLQLSSVKENGCFVIHHNEKLIKLASKFEIINKIIKEKQDFIELIELGKLFDVKILTPDFTMTLLTGNGYSSGNTYVQATCIDEGINNRTKEEISFLKKLIDIIKIELDSFFIAEIYPYLEKKDLNK
jgi:hypothetical protein